MMRHFIIRQISCLAKANDIKLTRFLIQGHFKLQTPCSHTIHCSAVLKNEVTDTERLVKTTSIHGHSHGHIETSTTTKMVTTPIFYVNAGKQKGTIG